MIGLGSDNKGVGGREVTYSSIKSWILVDQKVTFLFLNVPIAHIFFGDNDFDSLFDIYILMMF